jgi:hypothetical protein
MHMPGRSFSSGSYRYGFQGQEKDDEIAGFGNSYTTPNWQFDSRLGRRWNLDPLASEAPGWSPYRSFYDNPISFVDPSGFLEDWIQNDETGEIDWDDDVTSKENTPEGYSYIGESDQDIVNHLFGKSSFSTSTWDVGSIGFDDFDNKYSAKGAAFYNISITTDMNVYLSTDVEYDSKTGDREFKGIKMFVSIIGDVSMDNHPLVNAMSLGKGADMLANGTQLSLWEPEPNKTYFIQGGEVSSFYSGFMSSSSLKATNGSQSSINFSYSGLYSTKSSYLSYPGALGLSKAPNKTKLQLTIYF